MAGLPLELLGSSPTALTGLVLTLASLGVVRVVGSAALGLPASDRSDLDLVLLAGAGAGELAGAGDTELRPRLLAAVAGLLAGCPGWSASVLGGYQPVIRAEHAGLPPVDVQVLISQDPTRMDDVDLRIASMLATTEFLVAHVNRDERVRRCIRDLRAWAVRCGLLGPTVGLLNSVTLAILAVLRPGGVPSVAKLLADLEPTQVALVADPGVRPLPGPDPGAVATLWTPAAGYPGCGQLPRANTLRSLTRAGLERLVLECWRVLGRGGFPERAPAGVDWRTTLADMDVLVAFRLDARQLNLGERLVRAWVNRVHQGQAVRSTPDPAARLALLTPVGQHAYRGPTVHLLVGVQFAGSSPADLALDAAGLASELLAPGDLAGWLESAPG